MGDDDASYETAKESSSNTTAAGFHQGTSTSNSTLHHLQTTPKEPAKTGEVSKTENNRQSLASFYQNEFDRECIYAPGTLLDVHHTKRKSNRTRANGIAALTNFAKPVVTRIYDIALGGISLLCAEEMDVTDGALKMDILVFDSLTNFEYLINQVTGHVKSKKIVTDPKSKSPTWRYSVEFVGLDSVEQNRLKMLFTLVPQ